MYHAKVSFKNIFYALFLPFLSHGSIGVEVCIPNIIFKMKPRPSGSDDEELL